MQYSGYLVGDEQLEFDNLHPTIAEYWSQLPGITPHYFLRENEGGEDCREVEMNLDTLWVDMNTETLSLLWRGVAEIKFYDFSELSHVYLASEPLGGQASPDDHEVQFKAIAFPVIIAVEAEEEDVAAEEPEPEPEEATAAAKRICRAPSC